jgi:glutamate transport system substrate-binding protein
MRHVPKRLLMLVLLLALALLGAACGESDPALEEAAEGEDTEAAATDAATEEASAAAEVPTFEEGTKMAEIQEKGVLTVGTKFDQPLFGLANLEGVPEGFDVEIAKLVAEAIFGEGNVTVGENLEFVEAVSANREPFIQDGTVDMVVATYTINDTRKEVVDFAGPYYIAGQDIMVPAGNPLGIQGVEDLNGKRVCTVNGSTSLTNVQQMAPQADLSILFDTYSQCADALADGRVDAVTTDNVILSGLVFESDGQFELVGSTFTEEPYGIGVEKGADEFRDFINDVLEEAYESGAWAEAFEATVGQVEEEIPEPPPVDRYESQG